MKVSNVVLFFVPLALSLHPVERRQGKGKGGGAAEVCFVWARGSLEPAPLGFQPGPQLQSALRTRFPGMKTYPVMYAASIATNISPSRTDPSSIAKGVAAFKDAAGCKYIVAGGYSQGAAVMHNAVKGLDQGIKDRIAGVALFGDTMNRQDGGHIKGLPNEKSKVWCNATDGVCGGSLAVGVTHLAYAGDATAAARWLEGRVNAMKGGRGSAGAASEGKSSGKGAGKAGGAKSSGGGKSGGGKSSGGGAGKGGGKGPKESSGGKGKESEPAAASED